MKRKLIYCDSCEAEFKINHDMDEEYEDDIDEYE